MKTLPPPLTQEEEAYYLSQFEQNPDEIRPLLIERNLRLVAHIAKKYQNSGEDMDDLISIGTIGLIKAIYTYDHQKGRKLGTYAAKCIENAILSQMRLWWRTNLPRAEKNPNGVFWHRFPRIFISFVPLRTAM